MASVLLLQAPMFEYGPSAGRDLILYSCSLGHYITCYVTPRNMSLYHMLCDLPQHVMISQAM